MNGSEGRWRRESEGIETNGKSYVELVNVCLCLEMTLMLTELKQTGLLNLCGENIVLGTESGIFYPSRNLKVTYYASLDRLG